ncbi:MAG: tetratricopeptide repeat protein [Bacteroidia bacterium]|jgi:tetratricopeptide (TPR) repeat protein
MILTRIGIGLIGFTLLLFSCKTSSKTAKPDQASQSDLSEKEELDFAYLFFDGEKEKTLGNDPQAALKFNQALRINPRSAATHYELSQIYLRTGNADLAEISGLQAVKFDPENVWYKLSLASVYEQRGKNDKLLQLMQEIVKADAENFDNQYSLASAYAMNGKYDEAIKILDKLESQYGINDEFSNQKKALYLQMKKPEKAIAEVRKLMEAFPEEVSYRGMIAEIYEEMGKDDLALEEYEALVKADPDNAAVYFSLAEFYRRKGDNARSFDALKKAMQNPEAELDLKLQVLGSYYVLMEQFPELGAQAIELCTLMIQAHPESARAHGSYGELLLREGKSTEALAELETSLRLDKSSFGIWNQLLLVLNDVRNFKRMEEVAAEAMELFPGSPVFYLYHGIASMQLKNYEKAIESLEAGATLTVSNNPLSAQFYASLGDCYHALNRHQKSDEAYEKALTFDASNTYVMNNYAYYLSLRKEKLDRALELSTRSNELSQGSASFLDTKAWIYFQRAEYDQAAIWIDKALEAGGMKSATIVEHKGDILWKQGKASDALDFWKKAKELGGSDEGLMRKIETGRMPNE